MSNKLLTNRSTESLVLQQETKHSIYQEIADNYQKIDLNSMLKIVGESGRFQYCILGFFSICSMFVACISFSMPFIYYEPQFFCKGRSGTEPYACTRAEACGNSFGYVLDDSVRSATFDFDLVCDREILKSRAQNIVMLMSGVGPYCFSFLSDLLGRKPIFFICNSFIIIGACIAFSINDFNWMAFGHAVMYVGKYLYFSMLYTYCAEVISGKLGRMSITLTCILYGLGQIILSVVSFWQPGYKVYFELFAIYGALMLLGSFFLVETPHFKFKKRAFLAFYESLVKIAKINSSNQFQLSQTVKQLNAELKLPEDYICESLMPAHAKYKSLSLDVPGSNENIAVLDLIEQQKEADEQLNSFLANLRYRPATGKSSNQFKLLFRSEHLKHMFLITIVVSMVNYTMSEFYLIAQKIGSSNISINSIFLGLTDISVFIIVAVNVKKINPRRNHIRASIGYTVLSLSIFASDWIFKWAELDREKSVLLIVIQTVLSLSIKVIVCFCFGTVFIYLNRLFPTEIRSVASGGCMLVCRIAMSFSAYSLYFTDKYEFHPLSFLWVLAVFSTIASVFCPDLTEESSMN